MYCPFCGHKEVKDPGLCPNCNRTIEDVGKEAWYECEKCGRNVSDNISYCWYCGHNIGKTIHEEPDSVDQNKMHSSVPLVRPWVRYFARFTDYVLFGFVFARIAPVLIPSLLNVPDIVFNMTSIFIWVFIEAIMLSAWGTTPGKWLLGTTVKKTNNKNLSYLNALTRGLSVWFRGLSAGIPLLSLITILTAYSKLKKEGATTWDRDGGYVVSHKKIGFIKIIIVVLVFIGFLYLLGTGNASE